MVPWSPLPTPDSDPRPPERLSDSLDRVLAGIGSPSLSVLDTLHDHWEELVGPAAAEALQPIIVEHGTLIVTATEPAWASHVRWLAADLVTRAAELLGPGVVTGVEARVRRR